MKTMQNKKSGNTIICNILQYCYITNALIMIASMGKSGNIISDDIFSNYYSGCLDIDFKL